MQTKYFIRHKAMLKVVFNELTIRLGGPSQKAVTAEIKKSHNYDFLSLNYDFLSRHFDSWVSSFDVPSIFLSFH